MLKNVNLEQRHMYVKLLTNFKKQQHGGPHSQKWTFIFETCYYKQSCTANLNLEKLEFHLVFLFFKSG